MRYVVSTSWWAGRGRTRGWEVPAITQLETRSKIVPRGPRQKEHISERDKGHRWEL